MKRIAMSGGIVCILFAIGFLKKRSLTGFLPPHPLINLLVEHVEHVSKHHLMRHSVEQCTRKQTVNYFREQIGRITMRLLRKQRS